MDNVDNNVRYLIELENREHAYVKQRFDELEARIEHRATIQTIQSVVVITVVALSFLLLGLGVFSV